MGHSGLSPKILAPFDVEWPSINKSGAALKVINVKIQKDIIKLTVDKLAMSLLENNSSFTSVTKT